MQPLKITAILAAIALTLTSAAFFNKRTASKPATKHTNNGNGFAVLELFTSEGCSSCPPADALLARVQQEAGNRPVYVLAYHVDYWNRLGWKDQFSKAQFSKRQYQYSRSFTGQVYTPQVIVNGKSECVGSDEPAINDAITDALYTQASILLSLQAQRHPGNIDISYQVTGNSGGNQLVIAVVQKHAVSNVKAGENEGQTLYHAQIVQQLYTIDLPTAKGTEHFHLPDTFNDNDWEVIGLIQNPESGEISAAARASFNTDTTAL